VSHPAYHLRPNKAVDRFLLIDMVERLDEVRDVDKYTYIGFGGPFLEDFRLMHDYFPEMKLISWEKHKETHKRQMRHKPCRNIKILCGNSNDLIPKLPSTGREIIWLDYTNFDRAILLDFGCVLQNAGVGTLIKITVQADVHRANSPYTKVNSSDEEKASFKQEFIDKYQGYIPPHFCDSDFGHSAPYISLIQNMFRIASENALPHTGDEKFQILNSSYYNDGSIMYSLAGIICTRGDSALVKPFRKWNLKNLDWRSPDNIDMPNLSGKERSQLERHLPSKKPNPNCLARSLGYDIEKNRSKSLAKLVQYSNFYRYYPHFAKVIG